MHWLYLGVPLVLLLIGIPVFLLIGPRDNPLDDPWRRPVRGADSEPDCAAPDEHLSRAARYARQTFGPEGR